MKMLVRLSLVALSIGYLAGCEMKYTQPQVQPAAMTAAEKDFDAVWQAAHRTLREYRFELDRQDRRAGVITSLPMTGMHFFEFWRKDAARPVELGESTVQTIYRTAKVAIGPTAPGARTYQARVDVLLRRSDKPTQQAASTSRAFSFFNTTGRSRTQKTLLESGWSQDPLTGYVELGHDRSLEAKLTAAIAEAADALRGEPAPVEEE